MKSRLTYRVIGVGKSIVMLHGWGMTSKVWRKLADKLSESFQVILIDLPGYGSNRILSDDHNLASICEEISSIIPQQSIVLGWSMGGLVAMWLAAHYPALVGKLILTNSTPCLVKRDDWPGVERSVLDGFKKNLVKNINKTLLRFISLQINLKNRNDILKQQQFLKDIAGNKDNYSHHVLAHGLDILCDSDLRLLLAKIRCAVLWILGDEDVLVPSSIATKLNTYLPQAQVKLILHAAHIPFISHPDMFLKIIEEFIYA